MTKNGIFRLAAAMVATTVAAVVVTLGPSATSAAPSTGEYAPIDRPGPALSVPTTRLAASLRCTGQLPGAAEPVLLVPATAVNSNENFDWSYEYLLKQKNIPFCTSDLPGEAQYNMGDIQNRADYLVYAIRTMYRESGHRIAMIGSSQGGEAERWALRFWPDTRTRVADVIALDSPNHGTLTANAACAAPCQASLWQQTYESHYIQALNSGQETFAGISYTDISTITDDVTEPNTPTSSSVWLNGPGDITNVAIQSICPGTVAEHLLVATTNPIAAALTLDAITHTGPAKASRISSSVCTAGPFIPSVPKSISVAGFTAASAAVARNVALTGARLAAEPALRSYVFATRR